LAKGQSSAALSGAVYKPARSALSTVVVNKSSHQAAEFCTAKKSRFFGDFAPCRSHNSATFPDNIGIEVRDARGAGRIPQEIIPTVGEILVGEEVSIFRDFAPYLSHNPATF
jgi:hypothetical protein